MAKKAIVTGASRGIGRGIALALAENGYDVAISYASRADEAEKVARIISEKYGRKCYFHQASLDKPGEGKVFFKKAVDDLQGLDLMVNNAGLTYFESLQNITEDRLDLLINLDFRNYVLMMREASRYMIDNGIRGSIINITSSRGEQAYPGDGVYGGLKAGLNRAIKSFALDVSIHGIRINNVAPGAIRIRTAQELQTDPRLGPELQEFWDGLGDRIAMGRAGVPNDIGQAVVFLASDQASYITGVTLRVDGGLILPGMPESLDADLKPGEWISAEKRVTGFAD